MYVKRHGICSVMHTGRSRLTAYCLMTTCFVFQGLQTPGKRAVCDSMETTYSKLSAYTANTIFQTISLQMIGSIKLPSFHLSTRFSFFRINVFSRTIRTCHLHPEENWDGMHLQILLILTESYEIKRKKLLKIAVLTPFCVIEIHKLFPFIISQETQDGSF